MARQPRIDYPGAYHHVMNRGADHQIIFRNDDDRELFITLWAQAVVRFGIVVVSFCLMDNHYHVVVISPDGQLSDVMQFVGRSYTQQFNHHHDRDGALCRGRFHSVLVDSDTYFERLVRYVELNPVAAGICDIEDLHRYPWSSFQYFDGFRETPAWLSTDRVLDRYLDPHQFASFVRSEMVDEEVETFYRRNRRPGVVLGKDEFVARVQPLVGDNTAILTAGIPELTLDAIDAAILAISPVNPDALVRSTSGTVNVERLVAVDLAYLLTGTSQAELAKRYGFSRSAAAAASVRRSRTSTNPAIAALRESVLVALGLDNNGNRFS